MRLDLGSCGSIHPGFTSVDIYPPADIFADLTQQWPWPDSSIDEVRAHDIFEHLPSRIHTMNELWRVLKPDAQAEICVPNASKGAGYFQDPTHVSPWCANTFQYFEEGRFAHRRMKGPYGIVARFKIIKIEETVEHAAPIEPVWKVLVLVEAVKS